MSELAIFSTDKSNSKFTLQAADIPSEVQSYPVRVTATLENGTKITATKNVTIKVTPTVLVDGESTSFVAKNGVGTAHYIFTYTPEKYNVDVNVVSVTSNNSKIAVSNVSTAGFDLSTTDITEDATATITMTVSVDNRAQVITMVVKAIYKEDSGPFILYNVGESADVTIHRLGVDVPMTKMYYKVVKDFVEGEEYDDSEIEYNVWENTSNGSKLVATVGNGQAVLLKAYEKKRWNLNNSYDRYAYFVLGGNGKFKAYGKIGALDGFYDNLAPYCYYRKFQNCTSLTQAPELPATTLAYVCYGSMFYNCTSLTQAPELPATTLADNCYQSMFYGCTGLTQAPELPATTLASYCYYSMFYGCTGLTQAPELPATTLASYCYYSMFYGCTKLNYVKALFTTTPESRYTNNWLYGVASSGTFVKNPDATWSYTGTSGVPSGWTIVDAV